MCELPLHLKVGWAAHNYTARKTISKCLHRHAYTMYTEESLPYPDPWLAVYVPEMTACQLTIWGKDQFPLLSQY